MLIQKWQLKSKQCRPQSSIFMITVLRNTWKAHMAILRKTLNSIRQRPKLQSNRNVNTFFILHCWFFLIFSSFGTFQSLATTNFMEQQDVIRQMNNIMVAKIFIRIAIWEYSTLFCASISCFHVFKWDMDSLWWKNHPPFCSITIVYLPCCQHNYFMPYHLQ